MTVKHPDLTGDQEFRIPLGVEFNGGYDGDTGRDSVGPTLAYSGCGSHNITIRGTVRLDQAQDLYDYLKALPGITP